MLVVANRGLGHGRADCFARFKVGQFGTFNDYELELRPGYYVAVGVRAGYRDVRIEFYVAPEVDVEPGVVICEAQI